MKLKWLGHASFKISNKKIIYFDPYKIKEGEKADIILISHSHFDHCSIEDIKKIRDENTKIFTTQECASKLNGISMKPGDVKEVDEIVIKAVEAYNIDKFRQGNELFHPKGLGIGFLVEINNKKIYFAGDTDNITEMNSIEADIALLPVGGTYTMNAKEAAEAAIKINPKIVIPMHYGIIVGSKEDALDFKKLVEAKSDINAVVLEESKCFEIAV